MIYPILALIMFLILITIMFFRRRSSEKDSQVVASGSHAIATLGPPLSPASQT